MFKDVFGGSEARTFASSSSCETETNRLPVVHPMYVAAHGAARQHQIRRALAEFHRRVDAGDSDVRVLVATGVPLQNFLKRLDVVNNGAVFQICFDDINGIDSQTTGEVFIIKFQGRAHQAAVTQIGSQLNAYAMAMNRSLISAGGSLELHGEVRIPDGGLTPQQPVASDGPVTLPRLLVEVEFKNRSVPEAHWFCMEYFDLIPQLQAVLCVKFFSRLSNNVFASLAVVYRRNGNAIVVHDAVSFGTAPLSPHVRLPGVLSAPNRIRTLPAITLAQIRASDRTPWQPPANPFISVPSADIFFERIDQAGVTHTIPAMPGPPLLRDLEIDLFDVLYTVEPMNW